MTSGDLRRLQELCAAGAGCNAVEPDTGLPLLALACDAEQEEIVRWLLAAERRRGPELPPSDFGDSGCCSSAWRLAPMKTKPYR